MSRETKRKEASRLSLPKILVVDDETNIRRLICLSLIRWGFIPLSAVSPKTAQERMDIRPDLAIIDIRLQGRYEAGVELCQWIKSEWQIPVIATTAYDSDEIRKAVKPFCDAFCVKPKVLDCLRQAINRLLPIHEGAD